MVEYLRDPAVVVAWAGLTLAERDVMLHRKFPYTKVSGMTISSVYKKHKIRKKAVLIKKFTNPKITARIKEQTKVSKTLLSYYMQEKAPVYYLDECMFTVRTYMQKEFSSKNENICIGSAEFGI